MKISVDTKEDTHEDLRRVIKVLQHILGESDNSESMQNQSSDQSSHTEASPMESLFGEVEQQEEQESTQEMMQEEETQQQEPEAKESSSTDDLFAELFSEEELQKMDTQKEEPEAEEFRPKDSNKFEIEFY